MLQGGTKLLAAHFSGTLLFRVSIISLAFTAGFLNVTLLPLLPAADCARPPPLLPLLPCTASASLSGVRFDLTPAAALAAALPSAAVEDTGLKPLTETLRGNPMVLMRVCSLRRAVVVASSTLVCLQCSTWEVLLALLVGQMNKATMCQATLPDSDSLSEFDSCPE